MNAYINAWESETIVKSSHYRGLEIQKDKQAPRERSKVYGWLSFAHMYQ